MIIKTLIWNIRHVKTQQAFERVINFHKEHELFIIALMELFQKQRFIQKYRSRLGMKTTISNVNGKIWLFLDVVIQ